MKRLALLILIILALTPVGCLNSLQEKPQAYIVTYDANGAESGSIPSVQTKIEGIDLILTSNIGSLAQNGQRFVRNVRRRTEIAHWKQGIIRVKAGISNSRTI